MLISRVPEDEGGSGEGRNVARQVEDHSHEYQTANELFELMAKNHNFQPDDEETLTTRDLVLIYKNIDLGTKLMSNANEFKRKTPNQYVETIVYNDDPESDSDMSEIYSSEDLHNVVMINKERIDLLNNPPSLENTLCHKFGDLELHTPSLTTDYDRQFLFKDPYIKEQLKNMNFMSNSHDYDGMMLPATLLDYICCKRLEDNYNFYMDSIIRYVKHTIDQLKRISNGDYLTDRAKEKWREVEDGTNKNQNDENKTKVLANSTSIPLHVERKITGHVTTWDDIVHSEVDLRSLSKILEKKIVVEVPKSICGSFRLFSKCGNDNLIISCKRDRSANLLENKEKPRVDVVLQLKRSDSGHVMSNISSIMILQTASLQKDSRPAEIQPLPCKTQKAIMSTTDNIKETKVKIIELNKGDINETNDLTPQSPHGNSNNTIIELNDDNGDGRIQICDNNSEFDDQINNFTASSSIQDSCIVNDMEVESNHEFCSSLIDLGQESSDSSILFSHKRRHSRAEANYTLVSPDDLRLTMQRLNLQTTLLEENCEDNVCTNTQYANKKKSPMRKRIKSPYENKSIVMEEKKRKKLLEIRQRRELKKIAMSENCKVPRHRFQKGIIMPQTSSSVTQLSITNKSFYNSIYGQALNVDLEHKPKQKGRREKRDANFDESTGYLEECNEPSSTISSQKFINKNYYFDDTVTEMMYIQMKQKEKNEVKDNTSESTSCLSNDLSTNLKILSHLISPVADINNVEEHPINLKEKIEELSHSMQNDKENENLQNAATSASLDVLIAPTNTPKSLNISKDDPKQNNNFNNTSVEFRKSIDKIYDLMNKLTKVDESESKNKTKLPFTSDRISVSEIRGSSTSQYSDSGTSVKHHPTSSNPSFLSFEKAINAHATNLKPANDKKQRNVIPKIIISTKSQTLKIDGDKNKKERRKLSPKVQDNPLKAISQLLHEFDNVQKTRHKTSAENKAAKKQENDAKNSARPGPPKRHLRFDQSPKDNDPHTDRHNRTILPKEKKPRNIHVTDPAKQSHGEEKHPTRMVKKQVADIVDEYKEARGEAVRGPSKLNARLNTLAQPKRSYVQAHVEDYKLKYGRNSMSERLQRLAAASASVPDQRPPKLKKRINNEPQSVLSVKQPTPSAAAPLERPARVKFALPQQNTSPQRSVSPPVNPQSYKLPRATDKPDILKKKMVAVESYVKNHYGRDSSTTDSNEGLCDGHKSRVPLLPSDIELCSVASTPTEESATFIGKKLHLMIDTLINQPLPSLTECNESNSKNSKDNLDSLSHEDMVPKTNENIRNEYHEHNLYQGKTNNYDNQLNDEKQDVKLNPVDATNQCTIQSFNCNSETELAKLESALHRRMSTSTFQKRLRLKNLTLTPKQSMQHVVFLQSGDNSSIVVKSAVSNIKVTSSKSETLSDHKSMSGITKSTLNTAFQQFPMEITTVGYSFPTYQFESHVIKPSKSAANDEVNFNINQNKSSVQSVIKSDKTSQCFKGGQNELKQNIDVQVKEMLSASVSTNSTSMPKQTKSIITLAQNKQIDKINSPSTISNGETIIESLEKQINPSKIACSSEKSAHICQTTSLDILADLLNEIQKITTCQTHITSHGNDKANYEKDLENIMNDAAALEHFNKQEAHSIISITSLDKLRQLESNASLYSFYISNDSDKEMHESKCQDIGKNESVSWEKPGLTDKEVSVEIPKTEYVNRFTEVPSIMLPVVSHGTNVSESLLILSEPSTQSLLSFPSHSNLSFSSIKNIIELPENLAKKEDPHSSIAIFEEARDIFQEATNFSVDNHKKNQKSKVGNETKNNLKLAKALNCKNTSNKHYFISQQDLDPVLKIKRDVLVTVYSLLVFTVFAALSFPNVMYQN